MRFCWFSEILLQTCTGLEGQTDMKDEIVVKIFTLGQNCIDRKSYNFLSSFMNASLWEMADLVRNTITTHPFCRIWVSLLPPPILPISFRCHSISTVVFYVHLLKSSYYLLRGKYTFLLSLQFWPTVKICIIISTIMSVLLASSWSRPSHHIPGVANCVK